MENMIYHFWDVDGRIFRIIEGKTDSEGSCDFESEKVILETTLDEMGIEKMYGDIDDPEESEKAFEKMKTYVENALGYFPFMN